MNKQKIARTMALSGALGLTTLVSAFHISNAKLADIVDDSVCGSVSQQITAYQTELRTLNTQIGSVSSEIEKTLRSYASESPLEGEEKPRTYQQAVLQMSALETQVHKMENARAQKTKTQQHYEQMGCTDITEEYWRIQNTWILINIPLAAMLGLGVVYLLTREPS